MTTSAAHRPLDKYVRFYDMTSSKKWKDGVKYPSFDFAPAKAKLELRRGAIKLDELPPLDELIDEQDAAFVSGQENFKKHFVNRVLSRCHAIVRWQPTQLYPTIVDENSTHGTFIMHSERGMGLSDVPYLRADDSRWRRLERNKSTILNDGDVIKLGEKIKLGEETTSPLMLFVEIFVPGDSKDKNKFKTAEVILDDDDDDDDDVVETTNPKLQQSGTKTTSEIKKNVTVVLSDDEYSEAEPEALTDGVGGLSNEDESEDDHERLVQYHGSDEELESSDDEAEDEEGAVYIIDADQAMLNPHSVEYNGEGNFDEDDDEEDEYGEEEEYGEEDEFGEEEEYDEEKIAEEGQEVVFRTSITSAKAKQPKLQMEEEYDEEYDDYGCYDDIMLDHVVNMADAIEQEFVAAAEQGGLLDDTDSVMDKVVGKDCREACEKKAGLTEPGVELEKAQEQEDEDVEVLDAASTSGSSSASSSETKITASDGDGTDGESVEMVQEKIVVGDVTMSALTEEPATVEVVTVQATCNKRSRDEVEEDVVEEVKSVMVASTPAMVPTISTEAIQAITSTPPPHKKYKSFGAGLAAGLVAGVVGTFVGLSSLALSDSSLIK